MSSTLQRPSRRTSSRQLDRCYVKTEPLRTGRVPFFAVIADEVTDKHANQEIICVCIRYVDASQVVSVTIKEELLDFAHLTRTTGEAVGKSILELLRSANLNLQLVRGQAYDGTASMSSARVGAQAVVKQATNPNAHYVHCHSHLLNLFIGSSCHIQEFQNIIGVINEVFQFFDNSPKRRKFLEAVLKVYCPSTRHEKLKGLCKTRWVERHTCLETFLELYEYTVACLNAICKPTSYPEVQEYAGTGTGRVLLRHRAL